ncbi:hypothetical protein GCM10028803_21960 [Larkinella knui]|uniref:Uncharacterized protein n=1 Tax=Larkinella knui TaxID=2025310 RepID=A0A3P1CV84_9BACT|nr:hypothetical protein [Larkinella knui]RRB17272.1 hypothetical protein EHT87_03030 [Larkinella knui]
MEPHLTIDKNRRLPPGQDYALLYQEGLKHIENLASRLWTDYNSHDPGITLLETLCYALTELGYRTDFDIKDLLAEDSDGTIQNATFFTPRQILTCRPVSENDYRKLVVDIPGVSNAWLVFDQDATDADGFRLPIPGEQPLFADYRLDLLTFADTGNRVWLRGLQKILLDLDETDAYGDLNYAQISHQVFEKNTDPAFDLYGVTFELRPPFRNWQEAEPFLALLDTLTAESAGLAVEAPSQPDPRSLRWKLVLKKAGTTDAFPLEVAVASRPSSDFRVTTEKIETYFSPAQVAALVKQLVEKLDKARSIVQQVMLTLHDNRNLGEDWLCVEPVETRDVGICADVDLRPDADPERVLAEMYVQIQNYLNPALSFYTLAELLDRGQTTAEIFEGPVLKHGFLDAGELQNAQLRREIRTSDLINLLMDVDGVLAVKTVRLTLYGTDGKPDAGQKNQRWCLHVPQNTKPVFSPAKSKLLFFKDRIPFTITNSARLQEVDDTLRMLQAIRRRSKLNGHTDDLPVPKGRFRDLAEYYSVQYELPQTYGIGEAGLPNGASPERKAQAKQLKAYLLFFDQLLADFFQQLTHSRHLLSTRNLTRTYFNRFLDDIKGVEHDGLTDELYQKNGAGEVLLEKVLDWDSGTAADQWKPRWNQLVEPEATFYDRRHRFLDHLLARFSESFSDYTLMLYQMSVDERGQADYARVVPDQLIRDKIQFLDDYAVVSSERGRAFNYAATNPRTNGIPAANPIWDTLNVSGLEKRAARLLGLADYTRRNLACPARLRMTTDKAGFAILNENDAVLAGFVFVDGILPEARPYTDQMPYWFTNPQRYRRKKQADRSFALELVDETGTAVARTTSTFGTWLEADKARDALIRAVANQGKSEGMYLIEHLLLRPRNQHYRLMPVCLDENCADCSDDDPYSFRATVVLPVWPARFQNRYFRRYAEQIIRSEAPAGLSLKICWVSNASMHRLETVYRAWLTQLQLVTETLCPTAERLEALRPFNDQLIETLGQLHSEYPAGRLHDCEESLSENTMILGNSVLGTF